MQEPGVMYRQLKLHKTFIELLKFFGLNINNENNTFYF